MRIVIAGGHGEIALLLGKLLTARGDSVVGIIRDPSPADDLGTSGMEAAVLDLESGSAAELAALLEGADAAVFAAGAGPGSGIDRKDTVDRAAAGLLADACEQAGVGRYVPISSIGVDSVRDGAVPDGMDGVFVAYLQAKLAAEEDLMAPEHWPHRNTGRTETLAGASPYPRTADHLSCRSCGPCRFGTLSTG